MKGVSEDEGKRSFDPAKDMGALLQAVERIGDVKLIVIDPIAMVAVKDSHRNAETRRDLQPVADLCQATGAAGLGIHHLAKGTVGREPQERLIGSVAFAAVARVVMIATKMPPREGERSERRVIVRAKSNIGPDEGGYVYSLEQVELSEYPIFASRVLWGEAVEGTAREVLAEWRDGTVSPRGRQRVPQKLPQRRPCCREGGAGRRSQGRNLAEDIEAREGRIAHPDPSPRLWQG